MGNQWVFMGPHHKAGYFWGRGYLRPGGWLTSHENRWFTAWLFHYLIRKRVPGRWMVSGCDNKFRQNVGQLHLGL